MLKYVHSILSKIKRYLFVYKPELDRTDIRCTSFGNFGCSFSVALDYVKNNPIVLSFGVGEDLSFDIGLLNQVGGMCYAFDPTPKSIEWVKNNVYDDRIVFSPFGLSTVDGTQCFYLPSNNSYVSGSIIPRKNLNLCPINVQMKKFDSIVHDLKINNIDLLKLDIEGAEFSVIDDILSSKCHIKQICVEVHNRLYPNGKSLIKDFLRKLRSAGFKLVHVSENYEELTFLLC